MTQEISDETYISYDECVKQIDDKINGFENFLSQIDFSDRGHHYKHNHQGKDYEFYFERIGSTIKILIHNPITDWNICIGQKEENITNYIKEMYDFIILKGAYCDIINRKI